MANLKHMAKITNTGRRCVVVFREMYDERGHVTDENHCLVFETDNLPDAEASELMRIVNSDNAQANGNLYEVLSRERLGSGMVALNWLAESGRLRKFETKNIELTPDNSTILRLDKLNKIVKMQKTGASQAAIENVLRDDTDLPPRTAETISSDATEEAPAPVTADPQTGDGVLDDGAMAQTYIAQAETFEREAAALREQAIALDPTLAPKKRERKKPATKKA